MQEYTQEFRRRALLLGVDLQSQDTLLKYIGGLHSYLKHTILMFNPRSLNEFCVQAKHKKLEGKTLLMRVGRNLLRGKTKRRPQKVREKRMHLSRKRERKWFVNIVQEKAVKRKIVGNYILQRDPSITITKGIRKLQLQLNMN